MNRMPCVEVGYIIIQTKWLGKIRERCLVANQEICYIYIDRTQLNFRAHESAIGYLPQLGLNAVSYVQFIYLNGRKSCF